MDVLAFDNSAISQEGEQGVTSVALDRPETDIAQQARLTCNTCAATSHCLILCFDLKLCPIPILSDSSFSMVVTGYILHT